MSDDEDDESDSSGILGRIRDTVLKIFDAAEAVGALLKAVLNAI